MKKTGMTSVAARILHYNSDRVPALVQLKYQAMSESCFRFFRGANPLFYEDLHQEALLRDHPATWICGDLHLENFGSYKGDNKLVYFDINDFDDAILAPFTWDIARMTTSIWLACAEMKIASAEPRKMARTFLAAYFNTLKTGKPVHVEAETASGILKEFLDKVALRKVKFLLKERTVKNYSQLRIDNVKQIRLDTAQQTKLATAMQRWLTKAKDIRYDYHVADVSGRIAGTGSLGQERFVLLAVNDTHKPELIDIKECKSPSGQPWVKQKQPVWESEAERVVWVQKMMQSTAPALLTSLEYDRRPFVLRLLQPTDNKINYRGLAGRPEAMELLLRNMGVLAASAHLRATGRKGSCIADDLIHAAHDEQLKKEILTLAASYARKTNAYYREYLKAYHSGFFN